MPIMNDDQFHEDELLSAYLDDQLDDQQRAEVEARLAADPGARELLGQLQTVSEAVGSLPRFALADDLRESVLAGAVKEKRQEEPELDTRRRWMYAAAAIAAALLLMFVQGEQQPNDPLLASGAKQPAAGAASQDVAAAQSAGASTQPAAGTQMAGNFLFLQKLIGKSLQAVDSAAPKIEPIEAQLMGDAPPEHLHVHVSAAGSAVPLADFDQLLQRCGIKFRTEPQSDGFAGQAGGDVDFVLVESGVGDLRSIFSALVQPDSNWTVRETLINDSTLPDLAKAGLFEVVPREEPLNGTPAWAWHLSRGQYSESGEGIGPLGEYLSIDTDSRDAASQRGTIRVLFLLHPVRD